MVDDGTYTALCSSSSFDDLFEIAQTCMGPHAACKTFASMEIASLDIVEGDLSIMDIQEQGPARWRISMSFTKNWREHFTSRLLGHQMFPRGITMVIRGTNTLRRVRPARLSSEPGQASVDIA